MDDRLAARLHRRGSDLRHAHQGELHSGKKIAVVYQNDDYGKDYLYGFRAALGKSYADANIVAREAVEATATIRGVADGARSGRAAQPIFAVFQLPTPTVRTVATGKALGFNPEQIYMNSVAAIKPAMDGMVASAGAPYVNGIITDRVLQGSDRPEVGQRRGDEAVPHDHREVRAGANANDPQVLYGVAKAETFVQALYKAGKNLDARGPDERAPEHELRRTSSRFRAWCRRRRRPTSSSSARCSSSGTTPRHDCGCRSGRLVEGRPR